MALFWLFLAVATDTLIGRLLIMWPDISVKDLSLSASLPNRTKPYPLDLPVNGSVITCVGVWAHQGRQ